MNENITDVTPIDEIMNNEISPTEVVTQESGIDASTNQSPHNLSQKDITQIMQNMRRHHGVKCRKKGFKGHIHQKSGNKLSRKLERAGSLYGRVSIVSDTFLSIASRKFKDAKENAVLKTKSKVEAPTTYNTAV